MEGEVDSSSAKTGVGRGETQVFRLRFALSNPTKVDKVGELFLQDDFSVTGKSALGGIRLHGVAAFGVEGFPGFVERFACRGFL